MPLVPTHVTEQDEDGQLRTAPYDPKRHPSALVLSDDDIADLGDMLGELSTRPAGMSKAELEEFANEVAELEAAGLLYEEDAP